MATTPHTTGGTHHITQPKTYIAVFIALVVLMAATVAASYWTIPNVGPIPGVWINNFLALGIAAAKALLVIMFFMGVKYSSNLTKVWVMAGFFVFSLMFFILADNFTRKNEPAPGWLKETPSALPRDLKPLSEELPPDNSINLLPRQ